MPRRTVAEVHEKIRRAREIVHAHTAQNQPCPDITRAELRAMLWFLGGCVNPYHPFECDGSAGFYVCSSPAADGSFKDCGE